MTVLLLFFCIHASASDSPHSNTYRLVMNESGTGKWGAIRYHPETGQSWYIKGGEFVEILEQQLPSRSSYQVYMARTNKGWGAIRLDTVSGKTWFLKNSQWLSVRDEP